MNIADLRTELQTNHPGTGAYDADAANAAAELNAVNRTRNRTSMTGSEILTATDSGEFSALSVAAKGQWLALCSADNIDTASGVAKSLEADLFGASKTRTALAAVRREDISRADELNLGFVYPGHIERARA